MKKTFVLGYVAVAALVLASGCASDKSPKSEQPSQQKAEKKRGPIEERLKVGMSKDEVRAAVGNPKGSSVNSEGEESWIFNDSAKAFIPYYSLAGKFHTTVVNFDKEGKVKNWSTSAQRMY